MALWVGPRLTPEEEVDADVLEELSFWGDTLFSLLNCAEIFWSEPALLTEESKLSPSLDDVLTTTLLDGVGVVLAGVVVVVVVEVVEELLMLQKPLLLFIGGCMRLSVRLFETGLLVG